MQKDVFRTKQTDSLISSCLHSKQNQGIVIKSVLEMFTWYTNYRFSISLFLSVERFNLALTSQHNFNQLRKATPDAYCAVLHDMVVLAKTSIEKLIRYPQAKALSFSSLSSDNLLLEQ